jgi:carbon storage regulator
MLVLSRKSQESVVIGGSDAFHRLLKVTVLDVRGTNVRLGFEVDASVPVHRLEVWERIHGNGNGNGKGNGQPASHAEDTAAPLT